MVYLATLRSAQILLHSAIAPFRKNFRYTRNGITTHQRKIKIDLIGTEIIATIEMTDLRNLLNGKTDLDTFILNYVSFI